MILSRITPHQFKKLQLPNKSVHLPDVNPDPLTSNVYSVGERILLAWINHHYNIQRNINWPAAIGGEIFVKYLRIKTLGLFTCPSNAALSIAQSDPQCRSIRSIISLLQGLKRFRDFVISYTWFIMPLKSWLAWSPRRFLVLYIQNKVALLKLNSQ